MEMTQPTRQVTYLGSGQSIGGGKRTRLGHLVVHRSESGSHLVREGTGDNHDVGLSGAGTEDDTETILVVTGGSHVHHLYGAASKTCSDTE